MREHFNSRNLRPPPPDDRRSQKFHRGEPGFDRPPPPRLGPGQAGILPVFLLKDAQSRLIIGPSRDQANAYWMPIKLEEQTVGYFGFIRHSNIDGNLDRLFAERVQKYLAWLLLGMLIITGLIAVPLAARFVAPIEKLSDALRELAQGHFGVRLEQQGRDEIADLQGDFNRLAETMARNLESRQRWIADISHELRTPVAVLRGEIEAILDGVRQPDQVYIKSLHQEIMRMTQLIDDLYQLSLSDQGAMSYKNEILDLKALLEAVVSQQSTLLENENMTIQLSAEQGNYQVFGDSQRLQQLFGNLANNSQFYTEKPGLIRISLSLHGEQLRIEWSDSAPGVSDAALSRLFERLYRVEASRSRNAGGSGLGLAICRNIVESMQGTITAAHTELGGVNIIITLPLAS